MVPWCPMSIVDTHAGAAEGQAAPTRRSSRPRSTECSFALASPVREPAFGAVADARPWAKDKVHRPSPLTAAARPGPDPYVPPVRLDDTDLPGLPPFVSTRMRGKPSLTRWPS